MRLSKADPYLPLLLPLALPLLSPTVLMLLPRSSDLTNPCPYLEVEAAAGVEDVPDVEDVSAVEVGHEGWDSSSGFCSWF